MAIRLLSLTALALLAASCNSGTTPAGEPDAAATTDAAADEKAIRAQVARWLERIKAKDAAGIARMYAADGAFMPANAAIATGPEAIEKNWAAMMATPGFDLSFAPQQIILASSGDMALDRGTYRLTVAPGGKSVVDTGNYVVVWRKIGGEWKAAADITNSDLPAGEN